MQYKTFVFVTVLVLFGCEQYQQEYEEVLRLEDHRSPASRLSDYSTHSNSEVKRRTAIALGRSQDPEAVPMLTELLSSGNASVRVEAAFALGQIAQPSTSELLLNALAEEKDLEVQLYLVEALSKVADASALSRIDSTLAQKLSDDIPIMRAEAGLALGRLAFRKLKLKNQTPKLAQLLQDQNGEARWRSAYALMRLADSTSAPALRQALQDRSARVRMQAAQALGALQDESSLDQLRTLANKDSDWRVRVNAVAALGEIFQPDSNLFWLDHLPVSDSNLHVRLTALKAIGTVYERHAEENSMLLNTDLMVGFLLEKITNEGASPNTWHEQIAAAHTLAQILGAGAIRYIAPLTQNRNSHVRAGAARALGVTKKQQAFALLETLAGDEATLVRIAALETLPKISAQKRALPIYLNALKSGDAILTAIAATNLAADSGNGEQHAAPIIAGYRKLKPPIEVEAAQMIFESLAACGNKIAQPLLEEALDVPHKPFACTAAEALKKLTGDDYQAYLPQETLPLHEFTYQEIAQLKGVRAVIATDIGQFELQFYSAEAPFAVLNFIRLAKKEFFNGLLIHRVVPNFVIQTGDPRGDMWGSPGYSIRSQFSRLRYVRGMVGMASVGPDTEGCQWFIAHSDQPHLDGRYSIFARVRAGMEVVDKLQVGNRILKITLHN